MKTTPTRQPPPPARRTSAVQRVNGKNPRLWMADALAELISLPRGIQADGTRHVKEFKDKRDMMAFVGYSRRHGTIARRVRASDGWHVFLADDTCAK